MDIPDFLLELGKTAPEHQTWLETLPFHVQQAKEKWTLTLGEPYIENASCSYVVPCKTAEGREAVLKLGLPHEEALHEIDGLRVLNGDPTVYLIDFDRNMNAMLLEKCVPGTQLSVLPEEQQDEVFGNLLPHFWKAPVPKGLFRSITSKFALEEQEGLNHFPDPELAKTGIRLKYQLSEASHQEVLLATDLHAGNVLKAERKNWLAIDIKPYLGDRAYDLTQHLLNCKERLRNKPEMTIRRVAALAGVSPMRLRDWTFARLASESNGKHQNLAVKIREISF
ncbi:MAG: aminoglycoside phosphotransferase family protein [Saprospiraceae bacterium]|nr:hypothetical protein [Lewinella sp.]